MRRFASFVLAVFVASAVLVAATAGIARAAERGGWVRPVPGPVVDGFVAPATEFGPGHRGADFAVQRGDPVAAAGDGVVAFAGAVGGVLHVVVAHHDGLRTTYSFLTDLGVHAGTSVTAGQVLARAAAVAPAGHPPGVLHFGLRRGDTYLDPMVLFRPADLAALVHLVPVDERAAIDGDHERSLLARAFTVAGAAPKWFLDGTKAVAGDAVALAGNAAGLASSAEAVAAGLASVFGSAAGSVWTQVWENVGPAVRVGWTVGLSEFGAVGAALNRYVLAFEFGKQVALGIGDFVSSFGDCTRDPPAPDGEGTGHVLVTVAGLGSSTGNGALDQFPHERLGYGKSDVVAFTYRADGKPYAASDTFGPVIDDAHRLGEQLKQLAAARPGQEVDLVGHSLGGVVIRAFLELVYDPADPTYPPIGPAVALAAPMRGAPVATAGHRANRSPSLDLAADVAHRFAPTLPPDDAPVVRDLAERSDLLRRLDAKPLPDGQQFLSVGAADDVVVPADKTRGHGLTNVVVDPSGFDHRTIVSAPETLAALRLAFDGRDPPCQSLSRKVRARIEPYGVEMLEHLAVDGVTVAGHEIDRRLPGAPGQFVGGP
jgi:hypothetical protein